MKKSPLILSIFLLILVIPFTTQGALTPVEADYDTFILSNAPTTNYEGLGYTQSGYNSGTRGALFDFNLTGLAELYDLGYDFDECYLRIWTRFFTSTPLYIEYYLYNIEASWDASTVTWNTAPAKSEILEQDYINFTAGGYEWNEKHFEYIDVYDIVYELVTNDTARGLWYGFQLQGYVSSTQYLQSDSIEAVTYAPALVFDLPSGGSGTGDTDDVETITDFLMLFLLLFLPSIAFGGGLAMNPETKKLAPVGFLVGLVMATSIAVVLNIIPSWVIIFLGIGLVVFLWVMMK